MRKLLFIVLTLPMVACGQQKTMDFEEYDPTPTLVVPQHKVLKAKYPFIDVHNHQWSMPTQNVNELVNEMNKLNMGVMVNLSGKAYKNTPGEINGDFDVNDNDYLVRSIKNVKDNKPGRIVFFTNISFVGFGKPGWTEKTVSELEKDVKSGARGLKIYKDLGMEFRDQQGKRIAIDDPRLDAVWDKAGQLGIPVIIHSADPSSFWQPMDKNNERWLELKTHPDRKRDNAFVSWSKLIEEQHNMFRKHKNTKFIAAHFGWLGNNLDSLGHLLDELPNVNVEFGAIIAELGRQPRMARDFFIKYQDRIMFGKDSWVPDEYQTYFRVLETNDEYFPYHKKYHAFWKMYGMGLPDEVLKKVYYKNALRIIPGIDKSQFPE
ncbi:MAG: amidohydrolase [Sphingobacteriales bacterium]|nr:MAG: amidohydrolase [Sphingobacteriales bacterium]